MPTFTLVRNRRRPMPLWCVPLAVAGLGVVLTALPVRGAGPSPGQETAGGCLLFSPEGEHAESSQCSACHATAGSGNHPVDVRYADVQARRSSEFHPESEVVRRGVYLEGGMVSCMTCHDARSPWRYRLALPPGSEVDDLAGEPGDPGAGAPGSGTAVSPVPLCVACHVMG